jgi:hypothetical protein
MSWPAGAKWKQATIDDQTFHMSLHIVLSILWGHSGGMNSLPAVSICRHGQCRVVGIP